MTATGTAVIQKAQYVTVGPLPMISGVIVKSGEKFRLDPDYKPAHSPLHLNEIIMINKNYSYRLIIPVISSIPKLQNPGHILMQNLGPGGKAKDFRLKIKGSNPKSK